jgi:hypothetical protein
LRLIIVLILTLPDGTADVELDYSEGAKESDMISKHHN